MPLDKPKSALLFNNYVGDEDASSKISGGIDDNDINLFFILTDLYYDFSTQTNANDVEFLNKILEKAPLENVVKESKDFGTKTVKFKTLGNGEIIETEKKVFEQLPEDASYFFQGKKFFYPLYNKGFFTLVIKENFKQDVEAMDSGIDLALSKIKNVSTKNKIKKIILLSKLFDKTKTMDTETKDINRKIITIDQKQIAILDYMFTSVDEDLAIPYVFDKTIDQVGLGPGNPPNFP